MPVRRQACSLERNFMEPSFVIKRYRDPDKVENLVELQQYIVFKPIEIDDGIIEDKNLRFRTELTELLLSDYSLQDIELIRTLFRAELDCERAIWRHDNLYQLSFYLYSLGQLEDSFLLYDAKYKLRHMDASMMQDRYSITVGHEPAEVIKYVEARFQENPGLHGDYFGLVDQLQSIIDQPDYDTPADYTNFIHGYFHGHQNIAADPDSNKHLPNLSNKPWWKFW